MKTSKLKRLFTILMVMCCMALLSSCANADGGRESGKYKIAIVPKTISISWFQRMESGIKEFNEKNGTDYYYGGPTNIEDQTAYVEQLLAEDWDAICIVPFDADSITPILERAKKEGILVITHEAATLDPECYDYDLEAFEPEAFGERFAKQILEKTGGKGSYVQFVGSLNSVTHREWCDAADAYISAHSDMTKIGRFETNDNMSNAYDKTKELLQTHPEITAIECSAATDMPGASRAVEELGLAGKVTLAGLSMGSLVGEYIKDGTAETFSLWDSGKAGVAMIKLAEKILSEKEAFDPNSVSLPVEGYEKIKAKGRVLYGSAAVNVTKDNLEEYNF